MHKQAQKVTFVATDTVIPSDNGVGGTTPTTPDTPSDPGTGGGSGGSSTGYDEG